MFRILDVVIYSTSLVYQKCRLLSKKNEKKSLKNLPISQSYHIFSCSNEKKASFPKEKRCFFTLFS